jgi:hypothetical protein
MTVTITRSLNWTTVKGGTEERTYNRHTSANHNTDAEKFAEGLARRLNATIQRVERW